MVSVLIHPAKKDACRLYRLALPIAALCDPDITESFNHPYEAQYQQGFQGPRLVDVNDPPEQDVIVFQRILKRTTFELMTLFRDKYQKAVVLEIDDDFSHLPPRHPTRAITDPVKNPDENRHWLMRAAELADLVTVSTPALAEVYGSHGRVRVLPNYVPAEYLKIERQCHTKVWVGWSGAVQTHVGDLDVAGRGAGLAIEETKAELRVIGTGEGVAESLGVTKRPKATGWVSLERYPRELAQLDVCIAPLVDNVFNRSKSYLKPLEAASLGVPVVMSPSVEYQRLHDDYGLGLIARNPLEWHSYITALVKNPSMRDEIAAAGREVVREHLTIEQHAWKWKEAWEQALVNRNTRAEVAA